VKTTGILKNFFILGRIFRKYYRNKWFIPSIIAEILSRLLGYFDFLRGNYHIIWKRVDSTKSLGLNE